MTAITWFFWRHISINYLVQEQMGTASSLGQDLGHSWVIRRCFAVVHALGAAMALNENL
jgi:hypothetical protein